MKLLVRAGIVLFATLSVLALSLSVHQLQELHAETNPISEPLPRYRFSFYLPDVQDAYFQAMVHGAEKAAKDGGLALAFHSVEPSAGELAMAAYTGADGVAVCPHLDDPETLAHLEKLQDRGIPLVLVNHHIPHERSWPFVGTNSFDIGRRMGSILATLGPGSRRVGLVYSDKASGILAEQELVEMGLNNVLGGNARLTLTRLRTGANPLEAEALVHRLVQSESRVDTLVFTHEADTIAAAQALIDLNLVGAYNLVGFGKGPVIQEHLRKGVLAGSIAPNPELIGYMAVTALVELKTVGYTSSNVDTGVDTIPGQTP